MDRFQTYPHPPAHRLTAVAVVAVCGAALAAGIYLAGAERVGRQAGTIDDGGVAEAITQPTGTASGGLTGDVRTTVRRLRNFGPDIHPELRRKLVRRTASHLASWIEAMRNRALAAGTRPFPARLLAPLALEFKSHELGPVRYAVDADLLAAVRDASFHFGATDAVTLDDVIVFRDDAAASDDVVWARQLAHARLFGRWGRARFARKYLENWRRIAREVKRIETRYVAARRTVYPAAVSFRAAE